MPNALLTDTAVSLLGVDAVRLGTPADAVEGVVPRVIVEPASAEAIGSVLEWASREGHCVLVRGSGTKLGWGAAPRQIDILISTARLNAVVAHRHGDLTATIQAGARLGDVNRALAQHRQWIPLDPPSADSATIGGIVATNDSGPRRHRYGAPRDLIIGVEFARADGRLAKGGGIVVKNVAGYDLPRLLTGSFGSARCHRHGDLQAVSAYCRITDPHRRAVEPVRSRRAGGEAVGEPSDADRARVCDPSAASHHQVRIDRGLRCATV